jgi:hypothetical protein
MSNETAKLQRKLDEESKLWRELKEENKELKAQIKEWGIERNEVLLNCVKLGKLVGKLRETIEEEKN